MTTRHPCPRLALALALSASLLPTTAARGAEARPPNVLLILTDDQGYGDLGCHGNKTIHTPNLDRLHAQSTRLTNFHVDPTCSPTRSAMMTGRYSSRTGVWHTIMGRSILRKDEVTLANVFAANGYRTGIFGKWHLGDNYPYRPQERGFHEVLTFGGGGIGQTPDFWGNNYFDDTLLHNGRAKKLSGYCTDVFFAHAQAFIESNRDRPFFIYLPTNAPHAPYNVADRYSKPYRDQGVPRQRANFYGMITNIDENVGKLLGRLKELDLEKSTLVLFMTDNGSAAGAGPKPGDGYNAGMRGLKGSEYDGGHRVPCFFRWSGRIATGADRPALSAHIDILPTLVDLCGLKRPKTLPLDGVSLRPVLEGNVDMPARTLFVHSQRIDHPEKWRKCAVMTDRWRLVNGKELYDMPADPGQRSDVASKHASVVAELRQAYEKWWAGLSRRFGEYCEIPRCYAVAS
jgi:arylsulfatase A-like enzyme